MAEPRKLRLGFVGAGVRGRLFAHLALRHPDVEVVGVHDLSRETASAFSDDTGAPVFRDSQSLVDEGLDSLVVATPDHVHTEAVLTGAAAGLHLFVEKPLATTTTDAVAMRSACEEGGASVSVAYLNRWHPAFRNVLAQAREGAFGRTLFQNARLSNSQRIPLRALSWAGHSSPGWFLMPHTLDIVAALAPRGRTVVHAVGSRGLLAAQGVDTWDGLQALLHFEDGSSASVESLWALPDGMPAPVRFGYEVVGEHASAVVEDSKQGLELYTAESSEFPRALVTSYDDIPMGPNVTMIDAFIQSLRDGKQRLPGLDEAMWVSQLIEAIHDAASSGAPVTVTPA